jgi:hypothetical protein
MIKETTMTSKKAVITTKRGLFIACRRTLDSLSSSSFTAQMANAETTMSVDKASPPPVTGRLSNPGKAKVKIKHRTIKKGRYMFKATYNRPTKRHALSKGERLKMIAYRMKKKGAEMTTRAFNLLLQLGIL